MADFHLREKIIGAEKYNEQSLTKLLEMKIAPSCKHDKKCVIFYKYFKHVTKEKNKLD